MNQTSAQMIRQPIYLNVYDLNTNNNSSSGNSAPFSALGVIGLGLYHTGVEINGIEYSFSMMGISKSIPQTSTIGRFKEKVKIADYVGSTQRINDIVTSLGGNFSPNGAFSAGRYDLTKNNCNHFSDAFCRGLCGRGIPDWVNRAANIGATVSGLFLGGSNPNGSNETTPLVPVSSSSLKRETNCPRCNIQFSTEVNVSSNSDPSDPLILMGCTHVFCSSCLYDIKKKSVQSNQSAPICPYPHCSRPFGDSTDNRIAFYNIVYRSNTRFNGSGSGNGRLELGACLEGTFGCLSAMLSTVISYLQAATWSWKLLAFLGSAGLLISSVLNLLGCILAFDLIGFLLGLFITIFALVSIALEGGYYFIPGSVIEYVRRDLHIFFIPYGKAAVYFFTGLLLAVQQYTIFNYVGWYMCFIGALIVYYTVLASRFLASLKSPDQVPNSSSGNSVSRYDEAALRVIFNASDSSCCGSLDIAELGDFFRAMSKGRSLTRSELDSVVAILDTNYDGKIQYEELVDWYFPPLLENV